MLKIYGADLSSPANKVRFCANLIGVKYEYIRVKIREGENRKEEFLKLNPAGKIPVIDDDGFALFESGAICKYLCRKNRSPLYPEEIKQAAVIDQWTDFAVIHVAGAMQKVTFNRLFVPMMGIGELDERSLSDGINFLGKFLPIVDQQLAKSKYFASDKLSLADVTLLASLDPAEVSGIDLSKYPSIVKWRDVLMKEDFYQKVHKNYADVLEQMKVVMKK